MNTMERVYKIYNLLNSRGVVSTDAFLQELEISLATFKRDLAFMKNNLNAPIEWDSYERGYRFGKQGAGQSLNYTVCGFLKKKPPPL